MFSKRPLDDRSVHVPFMNRLFATESLAAFATQHVKIQQSQYDHVTDMDQRSQREHVTNFLINNNMALIPDSQQLNIKDISNDILN